MAHMRQTDKPKGTRFAVALAGGAIAIGLALALPTSAHAWGTSPSGGMHGGGGSWHGGGGSWHGGSSSWHGGSMHSHDDHDHTFTSFSLALGFPSYSSPPPAYYYPYPVYYAPAPVVVPAGAPCRQGQWRQSDGSIVSGVACLGPDGNWRLAY